MIETVDAVPPGAPPTVDAAEMVESLVLDAPSTKGFNKICEK